MHVTSSPNPNLAPPATLDEVAGALADQGEDPTAGRVEQIHQVVSGAELPSRLDRASLLSVLVSAAVCRETLSLRLGEGEAKRVSNSTLVRALETARIYQLSEPVGHAIGFATQAKVTDGVVRWASNGRVPPQEILDLWSFLGKSFDPLKSATVRSEETQQFLAGYRAMNSAREPSADTLAEMRAAFGADAQVVDVVTGDRYDLRVKSTVASTPRGVSEWVLGYSDLETMEQQIARLRARREAARGFFDLVAGVVVDEELAGAGGMSFTLMPDAHHTGEDIERSAAELRRNRDVVSLCYVRLEEFKPALRTGPSEAPSLDM